MTHGFDDEGGNTMKRKSCQLVTSKDEAEFKKRAGAIIKQFDEYEPVPDYHINGKATTGETSLTRGILLGIEAFKKTLNNIKRKRSPGHADAKVFPGYALDGFKPGRAIENVC
jgi:predicted metalloendopeptidase